MIIQLDNGVILDSDTETTVYMSVSFLLLYYYYFSMYCIWLTIFFSFTAIILNTSMSKSSTGKICYGKINVMFLPREKSQT